MPNANIIKRVYDQRSPLFAVLFTTVKKQQRRKWHNFANILGRPSCIFGGQQIF
jgi:hypothetical protein